MLNDLAYIMVIILLLGIICLGILYVIAIRKKNRLESAKKELESSYEELEDNYEVLSNQGKELMNLYDKSRQSEEKLRKIAYVDTLTELPNRDAVLDHITNILKTLSEEEKVALLYLDVNNLKEVNDTLGYTYGDELLIDITYRIKQVLGDDDLMGRISGDEFVILTQNIKELDSYEEKIKKIMTVFNYPFSLAEKDCFISVNIGICWVDKDIKNASNVIKNANAAMIRGKELGEGQYCYFDEEIQQGLMDQIQRQTDVRVAFEKDEFFPVFQPILDIKEHKIIGLEMLLRWDNPNEGILYPSDFLEAAIESGIIVPLGISFLKKACLAMIEWEQEGFNDLVLMINLSERQLLDYDIIADFDLIIKETKIAPEKLVFDISEQSFESNEALIIKRIRELKTLGVGICLDNFGSVKGGLSQVLTSNYDYIKIDSSLTHTLAIDEKLARFVKDLGSLFTHLNSKVIFEGIEEADQLEKVESFDSKLVQGFLFGNPLLEQEVVNYLETWMA